jgi:hypothetical protein
MSGRIIESNRSEVSFGPFQGTAGVAWREEGAIEVAFRADLKGLRGVRDGLVDRRPVAVLKIERSLWIAGMVLITCEAMADGGNDNE